ncbi:MAG: hypothetical protein ABI193_14345 [Minicystis sp.]
MSQAARSPSVRSRPKPATKRALSKSPSATPKTRDRSRPKRASKISITVDAQVLDDIKRVLRGTGLSLSAHITEALERDLRRRRLQALIEEYEAESGTITEDELAEIRSQWGA